MKIHLLLSALRLGFGTDAVFSATPAQQFLDNLYGAPGVDVDKLCLPNDDLWMLSGPTNEAQIQAVAEAKVNVHSNEVFFAPINSDLCVVEMRDGKIDAGFNFESVYTSHRKLILYFIYACLADDKKALARFTTHPQNVKITGRGKVGDGDLDQYQEIISSIPVVRSSLPSADKISKSVTYRFPMLGKAVAVRLTKEAGAWKLTRVLRSRFRSSFFPIARIARLAAAAGFQAARRLGPVFFPGRDCRIEVRKLALEELEVVLEIPLGTAVKLLALARAFRESPGK